MLVRIRNPMNLNREQKIALGIGAGVLLAGVTVATVAWASDNDPPPPKKALTATEGCTSYAITSQQQLRDDLRSRLRVAATSGPVDPLSVTAQYIRSQVPRCPTYPARTETPSQVRLFADVYVKLLEVMQEEQFLPPDDFTAWYSMMATWAANQGVSPQDL